MFTHTSVRKTSQHSEQHLFMDLWHILVVGLLKASTLMLFPLYFDSFFLSFFQFMTALWMHNCLYGTARQHCSNFSVCRYFTGCACQFQFFIICRLLDLFLFFLIEMNDRKWILNRTDCKHFQRLKLHEATSHAGGYKRQQEVTLWTLLPRDHFGVMSVNCTLHAQAYSRLACGWISKTQEREMIEH